MGERPFFALDRRQPMPFTSSSLDVERLAPLALSARVLISIQHSAFKIQSLVRRIGIVLEQRGQGGIR